MKLYSKVRIKSEKVIGTVVDVSTVNHKRLCTVESDTKGPVKGHDGGDWPLYDCEESDLEVISDH